MVFTTQLESKPGLGVWRQMSKPVYHHSAKSARNKNLLWNGAFLIFGKNITHKRKYKFEQKLFTALLSS